MVTRRRLIPLLIAATILPAACASAPPPILVSTVAVSRPSLAPSVPLVVLTSTGTPRLIGACGRSAHRTSHHASTCRLRDERRVAAAHAPPALVTPPVATRPLVAMAAAAPVPAAGVAPTARAHLAALPTPVPILQDRMDGAIKVYAYAPGRVFSIDAAPLHVTTLTLEPGETLIDKAAGDTVRWEIGDTTSGAGETARTLVMLKPLSAGLATNMVLTTSRRVYLLNLASNAHKADTAVAWSYAAPLAPQRTVAVGRAADPAPVTLGVVSARYAITPVGRRPGWTPQAVFDDGQRTFIAFGPALASHDAPLLYVAGPDGQPALVNYRQAGDLYIVDRVFARAELRLGDRPGQIVRLAKLDAGAAP